MSEWQPIDTAPKDGTEIIVAEPGFYSGRTNGYEIEAVCWQADKRYSLGGWWRGGRMLIVLPTYWMPLPPAPSKGEK